MSVLVILKVACCCKLFGTKATAIGFFARVRFEVVVQARLVAEHLAAPKVRTLDPWSLALFARVLHQLGNIGIYLLKSVAVHDFFFGMSVCILLKVINNVVIVTNFVFAIWGVGGIHALSLVQSEVVHMHCFVVQHQLPQIKCLIRTQAAVLIRRFCFLFCVNA